MMMIQFLKMKNYLVYDDRKSYYPWRVLVKCYQGKDIGSVEIEHKGNYENFHYFEGLNLKHVVLVDIQHMVMMVMNKLKDQNAGG